jgi:hypothetical protein
MRLWKRGPCKHKRNITLATAEGYPYQVCERCGDQTRPLKVKNGRGYGNHIYAATDREHIALLLRLLSVDGLAEALKPHDVPPTDEGQNA